MSEEKCLERVCLGDFALPNYCRDAYAECTLPKGHDGEHRVTYQDSRRRVTVTFADLGVPPYE